MTRLIRNTALAQALRLSCSLIAASMAMPSNATAQELGGWDFYGQLNFGLMSVDNGSGHETYFAENPHVPSRVGLLFQRPVEGDASVSFRFETGLGFTNLSNVSPTNDDLDVAFSRSTLRFLEVVYDNPTMGRFSFGQGSMASDGASGVDLSGTGLAHGPAIGDLGGATEFLFANGLPSGTTVSDAYDDLDGPRRFRIRYDTPEWNGFRLAAAYGQEVLRSGNNFDYRDIGLTYAHETEKYVFEAAASYEWIDSTEERALASGSVLHKSSGLTATLATGANQIGDGGYVYVKVGIIRDVFGLGQTAAALEFYDGQDFAFVGAESRAVGLGVTQNIQKLNLDLVATLRRYDLSSPGAQYQDIDVAMIGARWRF